MSTRHSGSWLARWDAGWRHASHHPLLWEGAAVLAVVAVLAYVLTRLFRRGREARAQATMPAWPLAVIVGATVAGYWYYRAHPVIVRAAPKPAPARTVIIHQAARAAARSLLSGTDVVIIIVAGLVVTLVILLTRKG